MYLYLECPSRSKDGCVSIEGRGKGCLMGKQRCVGIVQWRLPVVTVLVGIVNGVLLAGVVGGVALAGSGDVVLVVIWPCVVVLVGVVGGVALVGSGVAMPTGVWLWAAVVVGVVGGVPLVGGGVVVSMGVGLLVDSAVLGALLVAVLSPVERCEMHIYDCNYSTYGPAISKEYCT